MKPEKKYYPRPLWFWNAKPTPEGIREIMRNSAERDGYAGFGILPYDACGLEYLGEEYLSLYRAVLEEAKSLGLKNLPVRRMVVSERLGGRHSQKKVSGRLRKAARPRRI